MNISISYKSVLLDPVVVSPPQHMRHPRVVENTHQITFLYSLKRKTNPPILCKEQLSILQIGKARKESLRTRSILNLLIDAPNLLLFIYA